MPKKGYKQSEEHKNKKDKFLSKFITGFDSRRLSGSKRTPEERKRKLTEAVYKHVLRKKFGLSLEDYDAMMTKQDNRCAICGSYQTYKKLAVDHDHKTGKVRGLLCNDCNIGIGYLKDNEQTLENAIEYLKRNK